MLQSIDLACRSGHLAIRSNPVAGCTLDDTPDTFWSSQGSASLDSHEYLLYKLRCADGFLLQ